MLKDNKIELVLIVAKCIVNELEKVKQGLGGVVLIVAKCIVNKTIQEFKANGILSINSSKVYCTHCSFFIVRKIY